VKPGAFHAEADPPADLLEEIAALAPENPFFTPAYVAATRLGGDRPLALAIRDRGQCTAGCPAFLSGGPLSLRMGVPSLPALGQNADAFWDGLFQYCRRIGVTDLYINTYASTEGSTPATSVPSRRVERTEYVIGIATSDLWRSLRQSHRQRVNRAKKAGLCLRRSTSEQDCGIHCNMIAASMNRRRERNEQVSTRVSADGFRALLQAGAGVLFQAVRDDRVLSSSLALLSSRGAYNETSGTCTEGMECGASHFLIFEMAKHLQERGYSTLNLGGVSGFNPGLHEFKAGFGAVQRPLTAVEFDLQAPMRRAVRVAVRGLRARLAGMIG
jgi:hypothetical protein